MSTGSISFSQSYLNEIKNEVLTRMDSKENGGNGDGKACVEEAYNDLQINSLLDSLEKDSLEYNNLKNYADKIPQALANYAGADKTFSAQEWAEFLNGEEWGNVLDTWHSSSGRAKIEMSWIDNQGIKDGKTTKGEVKVGILKNIAQSGRKLDTEEIEAIIDKYAGDDGTFTLEEYTSLKNDEIYKNFLDENGVSPLYSNAQKDTDVQPEAGIFTTIKNFFGNIFNALFGKKEE